MMSIILLHIFIISTNLIYSSDTLARFSQKEESAIGQPINFPFYAPIPVKYP